MKKGPFVNQVDEIEFYKSMAIGFEDAANRKDELITSLIKQFNTKNAENAELVQKVKELETQLAAEKNRADAAVKDLKAIATYYDSCLCCKDYTAGLVAKSTCCSGWEWRGDHGTEGER